MAVGASGSVVEPGGRCEDSGAAGGGGAVRGPRCLRSLRDGLADGMHRGMGCHAGAEAPCRGARTGRRVGVGPPTTRTPTPVREGSSPGARMTGRVSSAEGSKGGQPCPYPDVRRTVLRRTRGDGGGPIGVPDRLALRVRFARHRILDCSRDRALVTPGSVRRSDRHRAHDQLRVRRRAEPSHERMNGELVPCASRPPQRPDWGRCSPDTRGRRSHARPVSPRSANDRNPAGHRERAPNSS